MSLAFLFVVPFVIGYLTAASAKALDPPHGIPWRDCIFLPWVSVFMVIGVALLFNIEGLICAIFIAPGALILGSLGGLLAGIITNRTSRPKTSLASAAVLPFAFLLIEGRIPDFPSTRSVQTQIVIHADRATVWQNIERVPPISPSELPRSWAHIIGFPRPIEATLSHEGIGRVRHAIFAGGVNFTETIYLWRPHEELAFNIRANGDDIPPTTLDEHVKVGGRYFDVLDGDYRLEPLSNGDTLLHLASRERISTHFNPYAGLWTDFIMRDIQNSILVVVKNRAERPSHAGFVPPAANLLP
jgi:hypothetical protein